MKYRKIPVEVEAHRWYENGSHPDDYPVFPEWSMQERQLNRIRRKTEGHEGGVVRRFRRPDIPGHTICNKCEQRMDVHGWIDTLEGGHIVCPGDYIITGVQGERYPCKPDIFEATYELVEDQP